MEEKNKGGRPKKDIDQTMFENLCSILCTKNELCDFFNVDEKTLTRWCKDTYGVGFSEIYKNKSAKGKMSLRRTQFKIAESNATMAIFLGKQYLGQRDIPEATDDELKKIDILLKEIRNNATDR